MDVAFILAENVVRVTYDNLNSVAIDMTKKDILDVLGVATAGSAALGVAEVEGLLEEWGGKKESTVIGFDCMLPAPYAALINGMMSHALDYDDGHDKSMVHAAASVVSSAFAVAQRKGKINGKDFITAVALGIDLMARMALGAKTNLRVSGWVYSCIFGYFGAAAAAGKILGLDKEKMVNAFGIAYSQTAGSFQSIADAVLTKRAQLGFAARAGVFSALLAERGITGPVNCMEGDYGIYNNYIKGEYDPHAVTNDLGRQFEVVNMGFKAYPSCGYTHNPIFSTLTLMKENGLKADDIDEINVSTGKNAGDLFEPLERKRRPPVVPDAQFSIPYTVGVAVVKGSVGIGDFTPEAIKDTRVLGVAQRVNPIILSELTRREVDPSIVEIKTKDGNRYSMRMDNRKGTPENPMTEEEFDNKFRDCLTHGRKHISKQKTEKIMHLIKNLEEVDDVGKIVQLLG
ncbi:MAG: MmgE/PrpD family protein [Methanomassiliicoccales archaeon]|nr:MAG: MmgE/PrpD family protein [Methanomassiliicoccales archaeon]